MSFINNSISLFSAVAGEFQDAIIGWHNLVPESTLSASSENPDNPVSLLSNYFTFDSWKASGPGVQWVEIDLPRIQRINYVGIAAHNFYNVSASWQVQYFDGLIWQPLTPERLMNDNRPILSTFEDISTRRIRIYIFNSDQPVYIGIVYVGRIMRFERGVYIGHAPANYNRVDNIINSVSEGGQFIGRSTVSEGGQTTIDLDWLSPNYIRNIYVPFQLHARLKPFFFGWKPSVYPTEIIFGWSTSEPVPTVSGHNYYSATISMRGDIEGTRRDRQSPSPTPPPVS